MAATADEIQADYLVIGAGATGMCFVDSLLEASDATIVIADRRDRPGGHWNDAYAFVRLHQPATTYGVSSIPLGAGVKDTTGLNAGFYALASGHDVISHFDRAMFERFLPSGRVRYFPMSEVRAGPEDGSDAGEGHLIASLLSGRETRVVARKVVDATHSQMEIPATHRRGYEVAEGVACVAPGELPRVAPQYRRFVVVGAGKTGMDTCNWLIDQGVDLDGIRWIVPRDSWVLNRARYQPGPEFFTDLLLSAANQVEACALARSAEDAFARLEAMGEVMRLDQGIEPSMFHGATLSEAELASLRRIRDVVRLGRVRRVEADRIDLEGGSVPAAPGALYIDCSARGVPPLPARPIFEGNRITLQWVRRLQPTLSAALLGQVEALLEDDDEKNRICRPIAPPNRPADWLRLMRDDLSNQYQTSGVPSLAQWEAQTRLAPALGRVRAMDGTETEALQQLQRYRETVPAAVQNLDRLLGPFTPATSPRAG